MFAYRIKRWRQSAGPVRIHYGAIEWWQDRWGAVRAMGDRYHKVYHHHGPGATPTDHVQINDIEQVRVVPENDTQIIQMLDAEIAKVQKKRQDFIEENFLTWPLATPEDCVKTNPGQTKAEAQKRVREANKKPVKDRDLAGERHNGRKREKHEKNQENGQVT